MRTLIIIAAIVLIMVVAIIIGGIMSRNRSLRNIPPLDSQTDTDQIPKVNPNTIQIDNFTFKPGQLIIAKGQTITWTNNDPTVHTITGDTGEFSSPKMDPGDQFQVKFNKNGSFAYHCSIYPSITGKIIVR